MDKGVGQGPAVITKYKPRGPDTRFWALMSRLQEWRQADHEDNIVLSRSDMITIIEGIKSLRAADATHSQLVELQRDHQAVLSERDAALDCAQRLATALWEKHYKDDAPHWTVGDDLVLVISQIDNMTADMKR